MPQVSIIVPVYNVENYLRRCIDSLINQTLKNIEIILINDGSSDSSGVMCDAYASQDNRIKVIHKSNGGVSSSRNSGLKIARGKFVGFIDPDDWVENDMFEGLVNQALKSNSYLVVCDYQRVYSDGRIAIPATKISDEPETIDLQKLGLNRYMLDSFLHMEHGYIVWNKLYKNEIIKKFDLRFETSQELAEDFLFNLYYCSHVRKISTVPNVYVNYFQRSDSLSYLPERVLNKLVNLVNRLETYSKQNNNFAKGIIPTVFYAFTFKYLNYYFSISGDKSYIERCLNDINKSTKFKTYVLRTLFDKECSNYLKKKGYRIKGRAYFRFILFMIMVGQNSMVIKRFVKV